MPSRFALLTTRRRPAIAAHGRESLPLEAAEGGAIVADTPVPEGPLSPLERAVLDWFVEFTALLSVPASVGQIYGLLYLAGRALPFENFTERLGISKGSASQGLRFLRGLGAVQVVTVAGDRREFYVAETSPTRLVSGFLEEKVLPRLDDSSARLDRIEKSMANGAAKTAEAQLAERIERLRKWNARARQFLPLVVSLAQFRA